MISAPVTNAASFRCIRIQISKPDARAKVQDLLVLGHFSSAGSRGMAELIDEFDDRRAQCECPDQKRKGQFADQDYRYTGEEEFHEVREVAATAKHLIDEMRVANP